MEEPSLLKAGGSVTQDRPPKKPSRSHLRTVQGRKEKSVSTSSHGSATHPFWTQSGSGVTELWAGERAWQGHCQGWGSV